MSDRHLRKQLIRLAHRRPELRPDLLPLLSRTAAGGDTLFNHPDWSKLFKSETHKALMELFNDWLGPEFGTPPFWTVKVGENHRRLGEGGDADGGCGGEVGIQLREMSPSRPGPAPIQRAVLTGLTKAFEAGKKHFFQQENEVAEMMEFEDAFTEDEATFERFYTYGDPVSEWLDQALEGQWEMETVYLLIMAFYYSPENRRSIKGQPTLRVVAKALTDGTHLPDVEKTTFDQSVPFEDARDLRGKLDKLLSKANDTLM